MGKGDLQVGLCSLALLTQPVETQNRPGPNSLNLPPAPGFTAQGFPPASAPSSGYKNSNPQPPLPSPAGAGCWSLPREHQGQATEDETSTHNSEQRGSGIPGADPAPEEV